MKKIPVRSIQLPDLKHDSFNSFKIRDVAAVLKGKDMQQDLHRHDFYFILALSAGRGNHEIDFVNHEISNYSFFLMRPGQVHRLHLKAGSKGYLIEFNKEFHVSGPSNSAELIRKATNRNHCRLNKEEANDLHAILTSALQEYTRKEEGFQEIIKASLAIFFIRLLRYRQTTDKASSKGDQYRQERLEEFFNRLDTHISTTRQVSDYANMLNLSAFQLNSITKGQVGKTAAGLIEEQVLLEAKRLLLATSNQVNQIADHLGYDDVSYFIRFFKKNTGHTPEAFRQIFH